ncbi:MAG: tRNA dihydrouridine synthase DusB [Bullifex sp.]
MERQRTVLALAPLAGYSDRAFRQIAHMHGADLAVTEMVSAEGLARDSGKTEDLLVRYEGEEELIMQIFAPDADPVKRCLSRLLTYKPSGIDINCGCPVPKVVKNGAGSALMKTPDRMYEMVSFLKSETDIPVSVKFRLGWDSSSMNFIEFVDAAVSAGVSMVTLHARTRSQGYSGTADHTMTKQLADHLKGTGVKVFGSGDIFTPEDALSMVKDCGTDGVMFARGAIGNPFIFSQTRSLLETGAYEQVSLDERVSALLKHLDLMIKYFGEPLACREMRKHASSYLKGVRNGSRVKERIVSALTRDEYERALEALYR